MTLNGLVRRGHRWVAMAFTLGVIANIFLIATGGGAEPAYWVYLLALIPLALLLLTGLYLFALPYVVRLRSGQRASVAE